MNYIVTIIQLLSAIGTFTLAFFACKSIKQTRNISKAGIKPNCSISPHPENLGKSFVKAYLNDCQKNDTNSVKFSCIIKNYGPGYAHKIMIMLCSEKYEMWTKRMLLESDILGPGEYAKFEHCFDESDMPSSETRDFGVCGNGSNKASPVDLIANTKHVVVEYSDAENDVFHAILDLMPRQHKILENSRLAEIKDEDKFNSKSMEIRRFNKPFECKPFYNSKPTQEYQGLTKQV